MANPQVEDGHLRIAYEVWEHLMCAGLGACEWDCVAVVLRLTWGWSKHEAAISLSKFVEMTERPVGSVRDSLVSLRRKQIIIQTKPSGFMNAAQWRFNKNWEEWKVSVKGECGKGTPPPGKPHSSKKTALSTKNRTAHPQKNRTPQGVENRIPPSENNPQIEVVQSDAPARKLQTSNLQQITTNKKKGAGEKAADARFQPALRFFCENFQKERGYKFQPYARDLNGLKHMLKAEKLLELEELQAAMLRFLQSPDQFHRNQGKPLLYFCANLHAFRAPAARAGPDRVGEPSATADEECIRFLESELAAGVRLSAEQLSMLARLRERRAGGGR